ncbi:MAG: tyrosine-type recombinase/integrase [Ktedonobacteraceae bacterium]
MKLRDAVKEYLDLQRSSNMSQYTIDHNRRYLGWFVEWVEEEYHIADVAQLDVSHLRGWILHLQQLPLQRGEGILKDSTIRMYGACLRAFCNWLEYEEKVPKSITKRFKLPKVEKQFIPTFEDEDVKKLLAVCEAEKHYTVKVQRALTARNRAIVSVLIDTGIRRAELAGLRLCDIDREMRVLLIHRKGNKWQQVPISYEGFKPLHEYLSKHRADLAAMDGRSVRRKEDMVFLADNGKPLTLMGVSKLFETLRRRSGIDGKKVTPHQCRRYMATSQLAAGRSPFDVQRQMGHTTLTMTNHYASLGIEQLKRSHEQYSPLRKKPDNTTSYGVGMGYWEEE